MKGALTARMKGLLARLVQARTRKMASVTGKSVGYRLSARQDGEERQRTDKDDGGESGEDEGAKGGRIVDA